jgi:hypothetical protein
VFGVSEVSVALAATSLVPEPAFVVALLVPYAVVLPYSKCHVVALPFGFNVPVTVADVELVAVVGPVIAVGFVAAAALTAAIAKSAKARNPVARRLPIVIADFVCPLLRAP